MGNDWIVQDVSTFIGSLLETDEKMLIEQDLMSNNILISIKKTRMHKGKAVFFTAFGTVSDDALQQAVSPKTLLTQIVKHIRHSISESMTGFVAMNGPLQSVPVYANGGLIGHTNSKDMILMQGGYSSVNEYQAKVNKLTITQAPVRAQDVFAQAARNMPGMELIVEKCPGCTPATMADYGTCGNDHTLMNTIINLNDQHHWSREKIAEWIENHFDEVPYFEGAEDDTIANNA